LPVSRLIGGAGKIPDMIWIVRWTTNDAEDRKATDFTRGIMVKD
jgi:hypothetical protein